MWRICTEKGVIKRKPERKWTGRTKEQHKRNERARSEQ